MTTAVARALSPLNHLSISLCLLLSALGNLSCGDEKTTSAPGDTCPPICPPLEAGNPAHFSLDGLSFDVTPDGSMRNARIDREDEVALVFIAGLWIAAEVGGQAAGNLIWSGGRDGSSNYVTGTAGTDSTLRPLGPFLVTPPHLLHPELNWPEGAPLGKQGDPRILGEQMIWHSLVSDSTGRPDEFAVPLQGLQVRQSFFAVREVGLENVIFCQWEVRNQSAVDWENTHVGFYSDTDLGFSGSSAGGNRAGYSSSDGLSYVYSRTAQGEQFVAGFAFVSTPAQSAPDHHVTSHRIMRKNNTAPSDFGETGFDRPEQILWALQGLSNSGDPMIDPTTNEATRYAFSGDPTTGEGWNDDALSDIRNMIGSGPFTVRAGATERVMGVIVVGEGDSLRQAIDRVRDSLVEARREASRFVD